FDSHSPACKRRHIDCSFNPLLRVTTLVEDRLQDGPVGVRNVSILALGLKGAGGAVPVPEGQRASAGRYRELLIKGAVSSWCGPFPAKAVGWVASRERRISSAVRKCICDYRALI